MLPFSLSCASQSSVSVVQNQPKKSQNEQNSINEDGVRRKGNNLTKSSASSSLQIPRPSFFFSPGMQKLAKGFKRFSNLFAIYKEEKEEEEEGVEMEIGCPTDVRHVAHIGWDGLNNVGGMRWEKAPEFFPLSSLSLREFELAMDSQGEGHGPL